MTTTAAEGTTMALLVDDIELNLDLLEARLEAAGYRSIRARNGSEALTALETHNVDFIISDILMPEMDGYQLCRHCKSHAEHQNIPFVFYTATYTAPQDEALALSLGADAFLIKPASQAEFFATIERVLQGQRRAPSKGAAVPADYSAHYQTHSERLVAKLSKKIRELEAAEADRAHLHAAAEREASQNLARVESLLRLAEFQPTTERSLFAFATEQALHLSRSDLALLHVRSSTAGDFQLRACLYSSPSQANRSHAFSDGSQLWERAARERKAVACHCATADPIAEPSDAAGEQTGALRNFLSVPVVSSGNVEATLTVASETTVYTQFDEKQLALLINSAWRILKQRKTEHDRLRLSTAIDQASEGIALLRADGSVEYANPAMLSQLGSRSGDLSHANVFATEGNGSATEAGEMLQSLHARRRWAGRVRRRRADGIVIECEQRLAPVNDEAGTCQYFALVSRDVTEQLRLEQNLRVAEKMSAIGSLAGGIAHDFNNILSGIVGFAELSLQDVSDRPDVVDNLTQLLDSCARAKELIGQILTFSRKAEPARTPIHVVPIVEEASRLFNATLPPSISMECNLDVNHDRVSGNACQLHQVIMNLLTNAQHALDERTGLVRVSLRERTLNTPDAELYPSLQPGPHLVLSVRDSGRGISKEDLPRIFEPYFTRHKDDSGTGLGLALVHGIIAAHRGSISVYSELGEGTVFEIQLPLIEVVPEIPPVRVTATPAARGLETILVVDDDEVVAKVTKRILERLGYVVHVARGVAEALKVFQASPGDFVLVITDKSMRDGDGFDVVAGVRSIRAAIPTMLCSGFMETKDIERAQSAGVDDILAKPVTRAELAKRVRAVLDR